MRKFYLLHFAQIFQPDRIVKLFRAIRLFRIFRVFRAFPVLLMVLAVALGGCGGKESILPQDGPTMMDIYERHAGGTTQAALYDARTTLRRPLNAQEEELSPFVRDQLRETHLQFRRLPNPDLVLFTFPHLATPDDAPVPGYMTLFPLYEHIHYALPGEPSE